MIRQDLNKIPTPRNFIRFRVAFSTKADGNMSRTRKNKTEVLTNRKLFFDKLKIDPEIVYRVRPSHSPNIEVVSFENMVMNRKVYIRTPRIETDFDYYKFGADGVLSFNHNVAVGLISADCIPLVIGDEESGLRGIIHVGLLGVLNGIVFGLERIFKDYGVNVKKVNAYLGPSISKKNYNVHQSGLWRVIEQQILGDLELMHRISSFYNSGFFDLRGMLVSQLIAIGFIEENIELFYECTANNNSNYFSHFSAIREQSNDIANFYGIIWEP